MSSIAANLDTVLGENLRILTQAVGSICQRSTLHEASNGELTENQLSILRMLRKRDHLTASEFARILGISNAAVTKIIDRLARLEMVERGPHPSDRRSMSLVIRPEGHRLLERYDAIASKKLTVILADFTPTEKELLIDFIQRIVRGTLTEAHDFEMICYQCGGRCGDSCVIEHRRGTCSLTRKEGD